MYFRQSSSAEIVKMSFKIADVTAKERKFHSIDETMIKLQLLKAAGFISKKT